MNKCVVLQWDSVDERRVAHMVVRAVRGGGGGDRLVGVAAHGHHEQGVVECLYQGDHDEEERRGGFETQALLWKLGDFMRIFK